MENGYTIIHKTYRLVQEMAFLATIYPPNAHSSSLTILQGGFSLVPLLEVAQSRPEEPRWLGPFCPRARTRHSGHARQNPAPARTHCAATHTQPSSRGPAPEPVRCCRTELRCSREHVWRRPRARLCSQRRHWGHRTTGHVGQERGQRTSSWLEQGRIGAPKQSALLAPPVGARFSTRPRQLSPPAVGTHQCRVGARFQRRQHWFIGYLRSAGTSNGVFISRFSCQYRPSQSDSVDIKNAYFSAIHYLQAKTTSGSPACHTKRD